MVAGAEVHGSTVAIYGTAWDRARDYERWRQEAQKRAKLTELRQALLGAWFRAEGEAAEMRRTMMMKCSGGLAISCNTP